MSANPDLGATALAAVARHVGEDEVPWVVNSRFGARMRLLQARPEDKMWVLHGVMPAGMRAPRHEHTGPVLGFTMSGSWYYLEHDFVNRSGSYLYEPTGSIHTLQVSEDEDSETFFVQYGEVIYRDDDGVVSYVSDVNTTIAGYYESCEEAGLPRPNILC